MAFVHTSDTYISVAGDDISEFSNSSDLERTVDSHDVTTYGKKAHVFQGGLFNGSANIGGIYDNSVGGPRAVLEPLVGTVVEIIRRPAGTGAGRPQDTVDALVTSYKEDAPIADMVKWTLGLQLSDEIVVTAQGA